MTLRIALVLLLCSCFARRALAAETAPGRVVIVHTGHEPACVDLAALARAVGRHTARATIVVEAEDAGGDDTTVRLSASGARAELELRASGRVFHLVLAIEPCETLPEQVGAAVAGSLTPAAEPPAAEPPAPPLPTPAEVAAAADPNDEARRRRVERAALLADVIASRTSASRTRLVVAGGVIAADALLVGVGAAFAPVSPRTRVLGAAGALVGIAGGAGTMLYSDRDGAPPLLAATGNMTLGCFFMGLSSWAYDEGHRAPGGFIYGSTFVLTGLAYGVEEYMHPHVAGWRVHRHLARLATPAARDQLTDAQLAAAERDVEATSGLQSRWIHVGPAALGAVVSLALIPHYADDDTALRDLLVLGVGLNAFTALVYSLEPTPIQLYRDRLHAAGLDVNVTPTPSGAMLGLSGVF